MNQPSDTQASHSPEGVHLDGKASGAGRVFQAGRDLHLHYTDETRGAQRAVADAESNCPYPGLAAFDREDSRWFFGRDALVAELIGRLAEQLRGGVPVILVAASGAGKTSLLQAGVLPALSRGALPDCARWPQLTLTPTAHPMRALVQAAVCLAGEDLQSTLDTVASDADSCAQLVHDALRTGSGSRRARESRAVLVVDQLEELFTLCGDHGERHRFIEVLCALTRPDEDGRGPAALVVCGLRADFYPQAADHPQLRRALQYGQMVVGAMCPDQLREVILYPAREAGLDVEPGLVELLLAELGADIGEESGPRADNYVAGRLPLLAHALRSTWQQRHGHILTVAGYKATGGIQKAVARSAENVFTRLPLDIRRAARTMLLQLVKLGDGTDDTRRRVSQAELLRHAADPKATADALDAFTAGRLITREHETVQITHEALLRAWPRLRDWIERDRAGNLTRQRLEDTAALWKRSQHEACQLYRGTQLNEAIGWAGTHPDQVTSAVEEFLAASRRLRKRSARLRRLVTVGVAVLTVVATSVTTLAVQLQATARAANNEAQQRRAQAVDDQLSSAMNQSLSADPSIAAQLALVADEHKSTPVTAARVLSTAGLALASSVHGDPGTDAAVISPDGRTLATASLDSTRIRLWDLSDRNRPVAFSQTLIGHRDGVTSLAFSPDGHTLASGSSDETVRLWNVTDPANPLPLGPPLRGHGRPVQSVAFSSDGRTLASAGQDDTVRLWNVTDPANPTALGKPLIADSSFALAVAFSPTQSVLASAYWDGSIQLWNVSEPAHPHPEASPFIAHQGAIESIAFSPDGRTLASASLDNTVRQWNVTVPADPEPLGQPLTGYADAVMAVAYSNDGHTLASASQDAVKLWNVSRPSGAAPIGQPLAGHTNPVRAVAFSPDGQMLVSASLDGTVRLWDLPLPTLVRQPADTTAVAVRPDGHMLAVGTSDGTVSLKSIETAQATTVTATTNEHHSPIISLAFSPDGRTIASGNRDGAIRLWGLDRNGRLISLAMPGPTGTNAVNALAFSPDGATLVAGNDDGTIRLWDVARPGLPITLGQPFTGRTPAIRTLAFSSNSLTLATGSADGAIQLWNIADPALLTPLGTSTPAHTDGVNALVFSPDQRTLVSAGVDGAIRFWNITDPTHPTPIGQPLSGRTGPVDTVAFDSSGQVLVSGGADAMIHIWDVTDLEHPSVIGEPIYAGEPVTSLFYTRDGTTLASRAGDVQLWSLTQARARICSATTGTLTPDIWHQYVPLMNYAPPCR